MDYENQIQEVELSIEQAKTMRNKSKALERLYDNKDFKTVILEGYFKEEASRAVLLKGDVNVNEEVEKQIDKVIASIGGLRAHFQSVFQLGTMAEKSLADHEQTREELLQEQLEGSTTQ